MGNNNYNDQLGCYYKIREILNTDVIDNDNIIAITNDPTLVGKKIKDGNVKYFYIKTSDSFETIQNYLLNKTLPDLETATKIAEIFNVSLDYLFLNELGIDADDYITYEDIDKDTYEKLHSLYKKADKNTLMYAEAFMDFLLTQNKTSK